jgi:hypothetical protein
MSLSTKDAQDLRAIIREEIDSAITTRIDPRFDDIEGRLEASDNDIKEIYNMISDLQKLTRQVAHFEKYDLEQKILKSYKNILALATEAGVTLPKL